MVFGARSPIAIQFAGQRTDLQSAQPAKSGWVAFFRLFPREAYRLTWEQLALRLTQRQACQAIVALLEMAAHDGVEAVLVQRLDVLLAAGALPDIKQLREEFAPRKPEVPVVKVEIPSPAVYDALLASAQDEEVMA